MAEEKKPYSILTGTWKGLRPALIAVGTIILSNYETIIPREILTPVVVFGIEFIRNYIKQNIVKKS